MWVYNDKLQIKFTFRSGPMIFGWVMALGLLIWDIDFIFGIWVDYNELQIKCTFCSGPIIFGWAMPLGFWNLSKYLIVTAFFAMLGDIDLTFGIWVYNDELQIKFAFRSGPMHFWQSYDPWTLKFGQIFSCHHFVWLYLVKLTRFPGDFNVNRNTTPSS